MKPSRHEVILAGSGGQGLVVSGIMLAEAAILEGKNVVQTASYGIASRGGFSMAEVIIDTEEIIFQQVQHADVVLVLTGEAMEKLPVLADSGTQVFYDTSLVRERAGERFHGLPFTATAADIGHTGTANTIALGCIAQALGVVSAESLARVIRRRFSGDVRELNLKALQKGVRLAAELRLPAVSGHQRH
jgi:2-oxoglutarate ferredoxin oxidoreductase subunit gamma